MDVKRLRQLLKEFRFQEIFLELNYSSTNAPSFEKVVAQNRFVVRPIAELGGLNVLEITCPDREEIPNTAACAALDRALAPTHTESLLIFVNQARTKSYFLRAILVKGKRVARGHHYAKGAPAEPLALMLARLQVPFKVFDEEGQVPITEVTDRIDQSGMFAEKVTKKFFRDFSDLRKGFVGFLKWIEDESKRDWYCSVLLNRLMFIYFIAEKGFLPGGRYFLRDRLNENPAKNGFDTFYTHYLLPLSFFGLGAEPGSRGKFEEAFDGVLYLNGGLFAVHSIEQELGIDRASVEAGVFDAKVRVPDAEFAKWLTYFEGWRWTLDESKIENEGHISPHILGYIFEKYINQKQMGAYYTKEDITGYICRNTIVPRLFDMLAETGEKGKKAVDPLPIGPHPNLLNDGKGISQGEGINRYIYPAVKTVDYLPTETDYEYEQRQKRYESILEDFDDGKVKGIDDFITYNLDIEKLALDFVQNIQDPEVLSDFYFNCLQRITVLDPTCGSGAFLFAALNILHPFYEAALKRMQYLVGKFTGEEPTVANWKGDLHFDDLLGGQGVLADPSGPDPQTLQKMRAETERIDDHPSPEYFIKKSIIVNNLFGVDIMEEAVEICKLRLFLTLIGVVEPDRSKHNLGVEPLPDIDFSILAGNTLVGYTSIADIDRMWDFASTSSGDTTASLLATERDHTALKRDIAEYAKIKTFFTQAQLGTKRIPVVTKDRVQKAGELLRRPLDTDLFDLYAKCSLVRGSPVTAHGADPRFTHWRKVHEPLHWFLEFPNTDPTGFEVIVGNPPYVEWAANAAYQPAGFVTGQTGNLYPMVTERCISLLSEHGRFSLIVPLGGFATSRMAPYQELLGAKTSKRWLSHFSGDAHPSVLFDGVKYRLSIIVAGVESRESSVTLTTRYNRWYATERQYLLQNLHFTRLPNWSGYFSFARAASQTHVHIIEKLRSLPITLRAYTGKGISGLLQYHRSPSFWVRVLNFEPFFQSPVRARSDDHVRDLRFQDQLTADAMGAFLSSTLFYIWYITQGNCRDLTTDDVLSFPVGEVSGKKMADLAQAFQELMADAKMNSRERTYEYKKSGTVRYQEFYIKKSKTFVDRVDALLVEHYGLSKEEAVFVSNFDIKYRTGCQEVEDLE